MGMQGLEGIAPRIFYLGCLGKHDAKVMGYGGKDGDNALFFYVS
jgi:hypothetical protein